MYGYVGGDPINHVDPSGKLVGLDDVLGAVVSVGLVVGVAEGIVDYQNFHSFSSAIKAAGIGFAMGASSAGAAILTTVLGGSSIIAASAAAVFDIGYGLLTAPTAISNGSEKDFMNGINKLTNQPKSCPGQAQ